MLGNRICIVTKNIVIVRVFFFLRDNYNMLLSSQLESFPLTKPPKCFVHGNVSIQLQDPWLSNSVFDSSSRSQD